MNDTQLMDGAEPREIRVYLKGESGESIKTKYPAGDGRRVPSAHTAMADSHEGAVRSLLGPFGENVDNLTFLGSDDEQTRWRASIFGVPTDISTFDRTYQKAQRSRTPIGSFAALSTGREDAAYRVSGDTGN